MYTITFGGMFHLKYTIKVELGWYLRKPYGERFITDCPECCHRFRDTWHTNRCCLGDGQANRLEVHVDEEAYCYALVASNHIHASEIVEIKKDTFNKQITQIYYKTSIKQHLRGENTWLYSCWNAGLLCVFIVLLSRSAFKAKSESVFHGGWYEVTSSPCRFNGESWRTGELATIGMPCIAP